MTIESNTPTLDKLLVPRPKIVFAETDLAAAKAMMNEDSSGEAALDYFVYRPASSGMSATLKEMAEKNGDGAVVTIPAPPTGMCVMAALTDRGRDQLREFAAWWSERGPQSPPQMLDLRNGAPDLSSKANAGTSGLYQRLFEMAQLELCRADDRVAQLYGQLHELRSEYEQARGVMRRIQEFWPKLAPFKLIEIFEPREAPGVTVPSAPGVLCQPLPTSAAGLAAIDLYSPPSQSGAARNGDMFVLLHCLELAAPVARWRVPYEKLGRGWLRCVFPVACTSQAKHLQLVINWCNASGDPPRLALSPVGAYPELRCRTEDSHLDDSLAMALWGTVPGTALGSSMPGWCTTHAGPGSMSIEYALEAADISRIRPTVMTQVHYLHPLHDLPGFRLHPMEGGPATGVLVNMCMANTNRVVCSAQIRSPDARFPVEYAICLTHARHQCREFPTSPESDPCVAGFSGWQAVAADREPHVVSLILEQPLTERADLHFATRMKDGASIAYGWADWLEVRIRVGLKDSGGTIFPMNELTGATNPRNDEFLESSVT